VAQAIVERNGIIYGLMRRLLLRAATLAALVVCAAIIAAPGARAQNLVQNPGFEQSSGCARGGGACTTSQGWTISGGNGLTDFIQTNAHTGSFAAAFGASDISLSGTLSQSIATTPLTTYLVSFYLANVGSATDSFLATFGGQTVLSLTNAPTSGYTLYSADITAGSSNSVLAFSGGGQSGGFNLDDVSVSAEASGAPAPTAGTGALSFMAGLICLAGLGVRRVRNRQSGAS